MFDQVSYALPSGTNRELNLRLVLGDDMARGIPSRFFMDDDDHARFSIEYWRPWPRTGLGRPTRLPSSVPPRSVRESGPSGVDGSSRRFPHGSGYRTHHRHT